MTGAYVDHGHRHKRRGSDPTLEDPYGLYEIKVVADDDVVVAGDAKFVFEIPADLDATNLVVVRAFVTTASSSGLPTVQIRNVTQAADMLTTKVTIDAGEKSSRTATTPVAIDLANDDVADGDQIAIDVDAAGTGAKGLGVVLVFSDAG